MNSLNPDNVKRRVVFGKVGSGKTNLARNMVDRIDNGRGFTGSRRVVYYDSNGHDYKDGVICEGIEQLKDYWRRVTASDFSIVYRPYPGDQRKDFPFVCRMVQACGSMVFVVDEMDMYFDKSEPGLEFADLIRRGRHSAVELIGVSQRPRQLGEIRSMAHELYIFDTHEPSDLSYYRQSFSEALVEKIKQLKQYEYVKVILPYDESNLSIGKETIETSSTTGDQMDRPESPGVPLGL